jgi:hypothetical protein
MYNKHKVFANNKTQKKLMDFFLSIKTFFKREKKVSKTFLKLYVCFPHLRKKNFK